MIVNRLIMEVRDKWQRRKFHRMFIAKNQMTVKERRYELVEPARWDLTLREQVVEGYCRGFGFPVTFGMVLDRLKDGKDSGAPEAMREIIQRGYISRECAEVFRAEQNAVGVYGQKGE